VQRTIRALHARAVAEMNVHQSTVIASSSNGSAENFRAFLISILLSAVSLYTQAHIRIQRPHRSGRSAFMFRTLSKVASLFAASVIVCSTAAALPVGYDYTVHFDAATHDGVAYAANDFGFSTATLVGPNGPCFGASPTPIRVFNYAPDATPAAGTSSGGLNITRVNGASYSFDAACNLTSQGFTGGDQHSFDNIGGPAVTAGGINSFLWWLDSNTGSPLDVGNYTSNLFYREVSDGSSYFYVLGSGSMSIAQIPEPTTLALFAVGFTMLMFLRRQRQNQSLSR
jgi:PEP-CTERM motif